ncbi:hypothetical protein [Streptomyces sp. RPT161]|nr:hypothetical protein [Streptomyces sp. RPT161]
MSSRSVHSARTVRMNLSACAFIRGVCGALFKVSMPSAVETASKVWV